MIGTAVGSGGNALLNLVRVSLAPLPPIPSPQPPPPCYVPTILQALKAALESERDAALIYSNAVSEGQRRLDLLKEERENIKVCVLYCTRYEIRFRR